MIDARESMTAKLCSFARAYHSNYERQKIFDDYLAYDLMGREEYEEIGQLIAHDYKSELYNPSLCFNGKQIQEKLNRFILPIPLSRAALAESELERFAWERGECQYVICGAGMDTFTFRNENRAIRIFEIDHPDTQRYKLSRIRQLQWKIPENAHFVPVNFLKDDMAEKLKEADFDPSAPTFFALLGVTYYLTLPDFEETLQKIGTLASTGSKLVFDFPDETTFRNDAPERVRILSEITASLGEQMLHGYTVDEVSGALARHGFIVDDHVTPKKIQKRFFEGRSDGQKAYENIHILLAKKGDKFNERYCLYI